MANRDPADCLNEALKMLSLHVIPNETHTNKGIACAQTVFELLQQHGTRSSFSIARTIHSGSIGKKTTITQSDFDCVIFVNHSEPLFEGILDEIDDILTLNGNYKDLKKTDFSVQFSMDGFDFDFLPASNFVLGMDCRREDVIDLQLRRTLDKIKSNPKKYRYMYSSSLAESVVRFFRRQDGFVHEMARLVKFWYKTLYFTEYISGAKSMIELVAVYAASREIDKFPDKSYLRCFANVLKLLERSQDLNIVFKGEYTFPEHQVPSYILQQRPLVLEPANPYNNLAKFWNPRQFQCLREYAVETRRRLVKMEQWVNLTRAQEVPMEIVFEPQPKVARIQKYFRSNFIVSSEVDMTIHVPGLKFHRNEILMEDRTFCDELKAFKNYLIILLESFVSNKENIPPADINKKVNQFIDANILGTEPRKWADTTNKHEDYDLTFSLPVTCGSTSLKVRISWKN